MSKKAVLLFAAAALFLLGVVVPPFQNPDEPHHFAAAALYARGAAGGGMMNEQAEVERNVIRMMDRAEWWRLVGIGRPQPLPKRLTDIEFMTEGMGTSRNFRDRMMNFELWHRLAGAAMRPFAGWPLERLYYAARAVSALFLAGALLLMWLTFELLGASSLFGPGVRLGFWIVFFLPQFWLTGTAVSPDAFVVLLGAAFFYGAAALVCGMERGKNSAGRVEEAQRPGVEEQKSVDHDDPGIDAVREEGGAVPRGLKATGRAEDNAVAGPAVGEKAANRWVRIWPAALVVIAPVIGIITDRSTFILAALAALLGLLLIRRGNWQTSVPRLLIGVILAIWAVYFTALRFPYAVERIYLSLKGVLGEGTSAVGGILDITGFARSFWGFVMDGMLLKFGWQVFEVSKVVYWVWRFVLIASGIGLAVRLVKWARARMNDGGKEEGEEGEEGPAQNGPLRARWFVFAVAAVSIQGVGMWAFYGTKGILGQGRYFFPVILPLAFLLAAGLTELGDLVKRGAGRKLVAAVILGEFLLFAISIWTHIIPVFHLILRGPHPGV